MINSGIEWTDNTYNPMHLPGGGFYCAKVSEGCTNCYAEVMSRRICGMRHRPYEPYTNRRKGEWPELELNQGMMDGWAKKRDPKLNFVSSMTDVFGEFVPDAWIMKMLDAMVAAEKQTFQTLTKRAARANHMIEVYCKLRGIEKLPKNIWIIFSVENQRTADERIPELLNARCSVRGLSMEPLLGPVDLHLGDRWCDLEEDGHDCTLIGDLIDWVIVGGESGHKARPMNYHWVEKIAKDCFVYNIPFFFKQWGEYGRVSSLTDLMSGTADLKKYVLVEWDGKEKRYTSSLDAMYECGKIILSALMYKFGKKATGGALNGEVYHQFPHYFNYETRLPK